MKLIHLPLEEINEIKGEIIANPIKNLGKLRWKLLKKEGNEIKLCDKFILINLSSRSRSLPFIKYSSITSFENSGILVLKGSELVDNGEYLIAKNYKIFSYKEVFKLLKALKKKGYTLIPFAVD